MSNYNDIKATINANIKANNNQEITGMILNSVLNQMIEALGDGYQFKGIAIPSTNPGTPDQKVFYLGGEGTYNNFGSVTVTPGNLGIFWYDSSWHFGMVTISPTITIVNDLITGGADKVLSAEMGKELNDKLEGEMIPISESLSPYPERLGTLGNPGWYTNATDSRHIAIPVLPGEKYKIVVTSGASGSFYGFVDSTYTPPTTNGQPVPYVGQTERAWLPLNTPIDLIVPTGGAYLILVIVDGGSVRHNWEVYKYEREGGVVELEPIVKGVPMSVEKALTFHSPLIGGSNNSRVYTHTSERVKEGCVINASLKNYSTFQISIGLMSTNSFGTGTSVYTTGWESEDLSYTVPEEYEGTYIRISVRRPNDANVSSDYNTIVGLLSYSAHQNEVENNGGLVQYVGDPIDTVDDEISLEGLTVQDCSLGAGFWYKDGAKGRHIAVPVVPGKEYRLAVVSGTGTGGFYGFVTSSYSPPYANGASIPYVPGTARDFIGMGNQKIVTTPANAAFIILCTVDGSGGTATWEMYEKTDIVKASLFQEVEAIKAYLASYAGGGMPNLKVAFWNVGHFALGANYDTAITMADYEEMKTKWRQTVNDIDCDVFLTCEYNTNFVNASGDDPAITAREAVWNESIYGNAAIGTKPSATSYMQTAIFSNLPLYNIRQVTYPQTTQAGRYYQVTDVVLNGKTVKVVATHLDFNQGNTEQEREQSHQNRLAQMEKLVNDLADFPYVIIGADCNVGIENESDYEIFTDAGYNLANCDYLRFLTYPAGQSPTRALDNIIVKGFVLSGISIVNDSTLSDHCAVLATLTMLQ